MTDAEKRIMQEKKYNEILLYFRFNSEFLDVVSYVSMDNIHDAIIKVGVDMMQPIKHYIQKAKQFSINRFNTTVRQKRIAKRKKQYQRVDFDWAILDNYGFTDDEKAFTVERIKGITRRESVYSKRTWSILNNCVKEKLQTHYSQYETGIFRKQL